MTHVEWLNPFTIIAETNLYENIEMRVVWTWLKPTRETKKRNGEIKRKDIEILGRRGTTTVSHDSSVSYVRINRKKKLNWKRGVEGDRPNMDTDEASMRTTTPPRGEPTVHSTTLDSPPSSVVATRTSRNPRLARSVKGRYRTRTSPDRRCRCSRHESPLFLHFPC